MPRYSGSVGDELMGWDGAGVVQDALPRDLAILLALLNADKTTALLQRGDAGGAAAGEGVEDEVARGSDEADEVAHERCSLDSGVDVAGTSREALGALAG